LKNDKASGDDFIINEYIKSSIDIILPEAFSFLIL
jgi:hypothetical protein